MKLAEEENGEENASDREKGQLGREKGARGNVDKGRTVASGGING